MNSEYTRGLRWMCIGRLRILGTFLMHRKIDNTKKTVIDDFQCVLVDFHGFGYFSQNCWPFDAYIPLPFTYKQPRKLTLKQQQKNSKNICNYKSL